MAQDCQLCAPADRTGARPILIALSVAVLVGSTDAAVSRLLGLPAAVLSPPFYATYGQILGFILLSSKLRAHYLRGQ